MARGLWKQKITQNRCKSANYCQIGASRYLLQLRWRPLVAAEAGAAASRAANSGHARAVAETAGCRLGSRRSRRRPRLQLRWRARAAAERAHRRGKVALGRLCVCQWACRSSMWSCGRSSSLVCVFSGRLFCACWGSGFRWDPKQDLLGLGASSCLFVLQVPPPDFGMCPGLVPSGGVDLPAGLWLRLLLLLARDVQSAVSSLRSSVVLRAVPPPLGVRCALFSVFVGVGRFSGVNKTGRLFGGASAFWWGFAFGLRLRASPSGFAFGLRLRARPKPRPDSPPCGVLERFLPHLLCFTSHNLLPPSPPACASPLSGVQTVPSRSRLSLHRRRCLRLM